MDRQSVFCRFPIPQESRSVVRVKDDSMFSRRKPSRSNKRLGFESLESRRMMDGGLFAQMVNGVLFINEAPGSLGDDQAVSVLQTSNGRIRVLGMESAGGGATLINGQEFVEFGMSGKIVV